ncbi:MAG: hypothetical protein HY903_17115 [Deltaproteobacteria bacterium]|nr:hypothetical protein [Deltaproteobacteria bacterium]
MSAVHQVNSEIAYDLMHEHLDTILTLLERSVPKDEIVRQVGSAATVDRMLRCGLVAKDGDALKAVANVYHQLRQEGMVSFLEHYVLPTLVGETAAGAAALLKTCSLAIDQTRAAGLRAGEVQRLFDALTQVSNTPATGPTARLTVMVFGTSRRLDAGDDGQDDLDLALRHLQQAALQRAKPDERGLAVLSQYVFLADLARQRAASAVVEDFVRSLEPERASSIKEATYHLTVATHWASASPGGHELRQ